MAVLTIGGEKGGSGKTTLAMNLAALAAGEDMRVMLVNTDAQKSATNWIALRRDAEQEEGAKKRAPISITNLYGSKIDYEITQFEKDYNLVVVDAAGQDSAEQRSALMVTDYLLIPMRPSRLDVWTLNTMDPLVEKARQHNNALEAFVVINQIPHQNVVMAKKELGVILNDYPNLGLLNTAIVNRVAYQKAVDEGLSVTEMERRDTKAVTEMMNLFEEVTNGSQTRQKESAA